MRRFKDPTNRAKRCGMSDEQVAALDEAIVSLGIAGVPFPYLDDTRIDGTNTILAETVTLFVVDDDPEGNAGWLEWVGDRWIFWDKAARDDGLPRWIGSKIAA